MDRSDNAPRRLRLTALALAVLALAAVPLGLLLAPATLSVRGVHRLTEGMLAEDAPAIDNGTVVFEGFVDRLWPGDVYTMDLQDGTLRQLTHNNRSKESPDISGGRVVWTERLNNTTYAYVHVLANGSTFSIPFSSTWVSQTQIDGDWLVWVGSHPRNPMSRVLNTIFAYNLGTGRETEIAPPFADHYEPRISYPYVVWTDDRDWLTEGGTPTHIYAYDLRNDSGWQVSEPPTEQYSADVYGNLVVWTDVGYRLGEWEIYAADVSGRTARPITHDTSDDLHPRVWGDFVAWVAWPGGQGEVRLKDLTRNETVSVTGFPGSVSEVAIAGTTLMWVANTEGNAISHIYVGQIVVDRDPAVYLVLGLGVPSLPLAALIFFRKPRNNVAGARRPPP